MALDIPLQAKDFQSLFNCNLHQFTFFEREHPLQDVVAVKKGTIVFYAEFANGHMNTFGIDLVESPNLDPPSAAKLLKCAKENDLRLVHWPSRTLFETADSAVDYLSGKPRP
jgi:hypothetical protein